jgi:branched-chain amino acid transport system ATP-binding protein
MTSATNVAQVSDLLLKAERVTKAFGGLVAVRAVDLEIPRNAIVSLIGPNGAGKTTFFNVILGILEPTSGSVRLEERRMIGRPVRAWVEPLIWVVPPLVLSLVTALIYVTTANPDLTSLGAFVAILALAFMFLAAIIRPRWYLRLLGRFGIFRTARPNEMVNAGIGRTFQNIRLFANMTARENVLVGMHLKLHASLIESFFSVGRARAEEAWAEQRADEMLALVGLKGRGDDVAKNMPYGDQRRLEVARALASEPAILLLDEPTAGMNPQETAEMMALIKNLRAELGISVLLIEHDMRVVMGVSDRITVLDHGERIAEGTPEEIRTNPRVIEAYLGKPAET